MDTATQDDAGSTPAAAGNATRASLVHPGGPALRLLLVALFALGLVCRLIGLRGPHLEGDEQIYRALVEQMAAGRGYTLQGHPLLTRGLLPRDEYDHRLFFHPPGAMALFWLASRVLGDWGYELVQLLSYALFYWSLVWLGAAAIGGSRCSGTALLALAALASVSPIMGHVTSHYWIDAPMLGLVTAAAAVLVSAVRRERTAWCLAAGALLGAASWVKVNAFFALPGIVLVAWATAPRRDWRRLGVPLALFVAAAAVVQMPWEIWQWSVLGTPFPSLPGRSSAGLVAGNRFVYYLTVVRSPWIYPQLIPRVLWTLVPALLLWAVWWHDRSVRLTGAALVAWMVAVTVPTMVLGALGYAKLVRYAILITPAVSLLWVVVVARAWEDVRAGRPLPLRPALVNLLLGLALLGCALELVQGVKTGVIDRYALIVPLF